MLPLCRLSDTAQASRGADRATGRRQRARRKRVDPTIRALDENACDRPVRGHYPIDRPDLRTVAVKRHADANSTQGRARSAGENAVRIGMGDARRRGVHR